MVEKHAQPPGDPQKQESPHATNTIIRDFVIFAIPVGKIKKEFFPGGGQNAYKANAKANQCQQQESYLEVFPIASLFGALEHVSEQHTKCHEGQRMPNAKIGTKRMAKK